MRIVYMGTPAFAVPMLEAIHKSKHEIVGVITAADKPAGRGMKVQFSEIKQYALENNLNILQPTNLKDENFQYELKNLNADLFVVVAFRMLPEAVWSMPPLGTINLHASLLPKYRGAAPIHWAVINGEKETGVTTFFLQHAIDTGDIILQQKIKIENTDDVGTVYEKLMNIGVECLMKTIEQIANKSYQLIPQAHISDVKHAPKIFKETCNIDWSHNAEDIYNKIRGMSPFPVAYTFLNERILKIFKSGFTLAKHSYPNGYIDSDNKTYLHFYTPDGYISCLTLQLEGKKKMEIEEFLRGNTIEKVTT